MSSALSIERWQGRCLRFVKLFLTSAFKRGFFFTRLQTAPVKFLFVHQNYPGQFKFLAPALARQGHEVRALTSREFTVDQLQGVLLERYTFQKGNTFGLHEWLRDIERKTVRGEACFRAAQSLRAGGFTPDVIVAHPGWGESLFLKAVWPDAKLGIYCEYFYSLQGGDVGFDPEFPSQEPEADACRLSLRNLCNLAHFEVADAGLSPTHWQASTFPESFRKRITVAHEGIDTDLVSPNPDVKIQLKTNLSLSRQDEVITFVNRNLEPYRGYHVLMRALPEILKRRPNARILIVGGDGVGYGAHPGKGLSWKTIFADAARSKMSDTQWSRVHFLGKLPYPHFLALLKLSTVHVYLTYPFVLSWSLLEAMSAGCAIVGSDTPPVREVITGGENGVLVDFFSSQQLAQEVCRLLQEPKERERMGANARAFARQAFDLKTVCLPKQLAWVQGLV